MSDKDSNHLLCELQHARTEIDQMRREIWEHTGVMIHGERYWPDWVVNLIGMPGGVEDE